MKLNKKSLILGIIIGGMLFGSIGVAAATYFTAKDISFTPTDSSWEVTNVQEAMDSLYEQANDNSNSNKLIYLGTGSSFDIKTLYPDIDYTTLTADNFIVEASSGAGYGATMNFAAGITWANSVRANAVYTNSKSYNSSTGVLTITSTLNTRTQNNTCGSGSSGCTYWREGDSNIVNLSKKVYLFY